MSKGMNLFLPLVYSKQDGPYKTTKTLKDALVQNLRTLFLTNPGERIMDRFFGIGIKRFLFENITTDTLSNIEETVFTQIARYIPYISIVSFSPTTDENSISVRMVFAIQGVYELNLFELVVGEDNK